MTKSTFKLKSGNSPLYKNLRGKSFKDIVSDVKSRASRKTGVKIELTGYSPAPPTTKQASTYVKPFIDPTINLLRKLEPEGSLIVFA